jgi:hypothetical protein
MATAASDRIPQLRQYRALDRLPRLSKVRKEYGTHLGSCSLCLLGDEEMTPCIKGAALYAGLCAVLDAKFPELLKGDLRASKLFDARLDFCRHSRRCRRPECRWCLELWARVLVLYRPGD